MQARAKSFNNSSVTKLAAVVAIVCGLNALGCSHEAAGDLAHAPTARPELPVIQAEVFTVALAPLPAVVKTQGSLIADEMAVVGAKVAGRVASVSVDLGDLAAVHAPLAVLDQEEFRLQIALAEAQLTQSRAALGLEPAALTESLDPANAPPVREARAVWDEIRVRIERIRTLRARNAVTQDELDTAVAAEGVAAARYTAAVNSVREKIALIGVRQAELSVAKQRLADTVVYAPFEGLVHERHVAPGAYVQVGSPVITLVRTSKLRFRGTIPERHAHRLKLDQEVTLHLEAVPQPLVVTVTRLSPGVEEASRALVFEALVSNDDGALRAGMFAEAEVEVDPEAQAIVIPQSAIVEFAGVERVWKLVSGVAQEQPITTSGRGGSQVVITSGLQAGDQILTDGALGQMARIEPLASTATASRPILPEFPATPTDDANPNQPATPDATGADSSVDTRTTAE